MYDARPIKYKFENMSNLEANLWETLELRFDGLNLKTVGKYTGINIYRLRGLIRGRFPMTVKEFEILTNFLTDKNKYNFLCKETN